MITCIECGEEHPSPRRFCGECGSLLPTKSVFTDLALMLKTSQELRRT
ncbi:MAG: hypothetical protein MUP21_01180 [Dehalococcoidia bacterium]|nr:hypothetical protein [Dehalococcoidia bacterium]